MGTNERNLFISDVIDTRMRILMSIRDFQKDFEASTQEMQNLTKDLISIYENGVDFLNAHGDSDMKKQWDELLNEIRVHINQMIHQLERSSELIKLKDEKSDFTETWKEFETHKDYLKEAALNFEKTGLSALPEDRKYEWEDHYVVFEKEFEMKIKRRVEFDKFILDFVSKYDQDDLVKIAGIVSKNSPENVDWSNPVEYQNQYAKAISEFQSEFKPQNLWDSFMELLAGGVHPSPSERIMLEKWSDGEQKTREDM